MKGNKKILAVALLLLLVAVSFGTYAIYKTSVSGNATVTAASWSAVIKNGSDTLSANFALDYEDFTCTGGNSKVAGKIAPGDTCTASILVDLDGSEVDAQVGVTIDTTAVTGPFTASLKDGATVVTSGNEVEVPYSATAGGMEKTIDVVITWAADNDGATDTPLQGSTIQIPVTITAHQKTA